MRKPYSLFLLLFMSISLIACSSDDDSTNNDDNGNTDDNPIEEVANHFTYDGSEIEIVDGLMEYGGPFAQQQSHIITLMLTNSVLSGPENEYQPVDPTFSGIVFAFFTGSSDDLEVGTYTYSQTGAAGTYAVGAVAIDVEVENQNPDNIKEITAGTLTVEENGDHYAIYFNGATTDGTPVSLHYEGAINNKIGFTADSRMPNQESPVKQLMKLLQE